MSESWEAVARALGTRLNHATAPDHNPPRPDCPYCEDAAAYARYVAKRKAVGDPVHDPFAGTPSVSIRDIKPNAEIKFPTHPEPQVGPPRPSSPCTSTSSPAVPTTA